MEPILLASRANKDLALKISEHLKHPLSSCKLITFANTEITCKIETNIRNRDVFIVSTGVAFKGRSVNDHLMEACIMSNACKLSNAKSITMIMPCYPYARQDKKDRSRAPITSAFVAKMLQGAGVTRVITMDLHAEQIQGMFDIPVDNLYSEPLVIEWIKRLEFENVVIVAPDVGAARRADHLAQALGVPRVIMSKNRDYSTPNSVLTTTLVGSVKDKVAIIYDDMCDTAGTLCKAIDTLNSFGAEKVIAIVTHGIFSNPACDRLNDNKNTSNLYKLVCTNTVPSSIHCNNLDIIDISIIIADTIKAIVNGTSVSALFS